MFFRLFVFRAKVRITEGLQPVFIYIFVNKRPGASVVLQPDKHVRYINKGRAFVSFFLWGIQKMAILISILRLYVV